MPTLRPSRSVAQSSSNPKPDVRAPHRGNGAKDPGCGFAALLIKARCSIGGLRHSLAGLTSYRDDSAACDRTHDVSAGMTCGARTGRRPFRIRNE